MIAVISLAAACLAFSVSAILPARYSSEISLLVIQKQSPDKVDAFSAAKSAEYLSDILSKSVYTDMFYADVMSAPQKPENQFSADHETRKQEWAKEIQTKQVNNTGIIKVTVLDKSKAEAQKLAEAIAWNFSTNGQKYHGAGNQVEIKLIDGPITSQYPTSPNIFLNAVLGFIAGFIGSIALAYFFPEANLEVKKLGNKKQESTRIEFWNEAVDNRKNDYSEIEMPSQNTQELEDIQNMPDKQNVYSEEPSADKVKERLNSLLG